MTGVAVCAARAARDAHAPCRAVRTRRAGAARFAPCCPDAAALPAASIGAAARRSAAPRPVSARRSWHAVSGGRAPLIVRAHSAGASGAPEGAGEAALPPLRCVGVAIRAAPGRGSADRAAAAAAARGGSRAARACEHASLRRRGALVRRHALAASAEDAGSPPMVRSPAWQAWHDPELRLVFVNIVLYAVCFNLQSPLLPVLTQRCGSQRALFGFIWV